VLFFNSKSSLNKGNLVGFKLRIIRFLTWKSHNDSEKLSMVLLAPGIKKQFTIKRRARSIDLEASSDGQYIHIHLQMTILLDSTLQ
jgi:hypothetical protein